MERVTLEKSFLTTKDHNPYGFYEELNQMSDDVVWDPELKAWLVSSYAACREIMLNDDKLFDVTEADTETRARLFGGRRTLPALKGQDHNRLYRWWISVFSPRQMAQWREEIIRPIINDSIDRFIGAGHAEMAEEFSERVPIRVIMHLMGLPWDDDTFVEKYRDLNYTLVTALTHRGYGAKAITPEAEAAKEAGFAAADEMSKMITPFLEARQSGEGDDLISKLWRDGPSLLEGWALSDMVSNTRLMLQAGSDTTTYGTNNAIYLLLNHPKLIDELREGGEPKIANFVEEVLRLHGPVHLRSREALQDTELAGQGMCQRDPVIPIIGAANRDPARYSCPAQIDLDRSNPKDHLSFHYGTHTCVGAALARAELIEAVIALIGRMPDMKLDPTKEQPGMKGWLMRSFKPLNITFSAN